MLPLLLLVLAAGGNPAAVGRGALSGGAFGAVAAEPEEVAEPAAPVDAGGETSASTRSPLKRKIDEPLLIAQAARLETAMTINKAFDGKFTATFEKERGRIVVKLFGGETAADSARDLITAAVATTSTLVDPEITISYVFNGPCSGVRGHEVARRELGRFVDLRAQRPVVIAHFPGAAFVPCMEEDFAPARADAGR